MRRSSASSGLAVANVAGVSAPLALSAPTAAPIATGSKNASCRVPAGAVARIVQFAVGVSVYEFRTVPMQSLRMPGIS